MYPSPPLYNFFEANAGNSPVLEYGKTVRYWNKETQFDAGMLWYQTGMPDAEMQMLTFAIWWDCSAQR
jgi:hypothetical protein